MKLVQIFLPLYDHNGRRFPAKAYSTKRNLLVERFGGVTAYMRSPARGLWKDGGKTKRDDMVILEVMVRRTDRQWWNSIIATSWKDALSKKSLSSVRRR